jgi:hypothetical protein
MAQRTDAVVKMYTATDSSGANLLPAEMAYEELGWSPGKIQRALALRAAEQARQLEPSSVPWSGSTDRAGRSRRSCTAP